MDVLRLSDSPGEQDRPARAADDLVANAAKQDSTEADGSSGTEHDQVGFEPFGSRYDRRGNAVVDHRAAARPYTLRSQLLDGSIDDRVGLIIRLHDRRALDGDHVLDVQNQYLGARPRRYHGCLRQRLVAGQGVIDGDKHLLGLTQSRVRGPDDEHRNVKAGGDSVTDAAQEKADDGGAPARADDQQIGLNPRSHGSDYLRDLVIGLHRLGLSLRLYTLGAQALDNNVDQSITLTAAGGGIDPVRVQHADLCAPEACVGGYRADCCGQRFIVLDRKEDPSVHLVHL